MDFIAFPKIPRLSRDIVVTEKIDGTNAQVNIRPSQPYEDKDGVLRIPHGFEAGIDIQVNLTDGIQAFLRAGSRTRWITVQDDNYGFAQWVHENAHDLAKLGVGSHFGEWWGKGINRNYAQPYRNFSLFNIKRWLDHETRPVCCGVVPVLYEGPLDEYSVMKGVKHALRDLCLNGSRAAPGFMQPEGIVVYHVAGNILFKKTLENDGEWKGRVISA